MFALLGNIEFTVAGGITGMEQRGTANWAEHARIKGKPLLEWIGEGLDEINLSIELHPKLGDPEKRWQALREAKSKHEPLALVLGNGDYLGPYVIADNSLQHRRLSATGQLTSATVQLSLREYTGAFTRKVLATPGLLNPALTGTASVTSKLPRVVSKFLPSPSTTQMLIGHAKSAANVLQAGKNLYDQVKSGNASMILGQVPQLLGVTERAIAPLQGLTKAAGLFQDGADLAKLGEDVLGSVTGARASLNPVDLGNIVERFDASRASLDQALTTMDGARTRLAGLTAQVLTRRA
ncbi:phage tail protein [Pseudomonas fontis]|uniref:Phage tail protein n=1 Tax=Pseudomonas fontis TaxID=2942633 RepID=A0ABT5NXK9_9PSED|nr:phage tail protein [Pseudomonas fontis]MDD0973800.1 phage tail protein [Pseudomonas fontis]MDD0992934.1 phage tail protein [Pseudomonas fontis]